ncbi:MAG: serine/threonine-protein phosphatase [Oscillospiraceae bacterium]|nr:serine/threonine-protein phosphatase [Oscillospiraceae bacterium]
MEIYAMTDIGGRPDENQDRVNTLRLADNAVFAIVCDGMGGENAGSTASFKTMQIVSDRIMGGYRDDRDELSLKNLMINSVKTANAVVHEIAEYDETKSGMGTTCVAVLRKDNRIFCVNVGDSRAYLIDNEITQITKDHTVVMSMYENGEIEFEEMKTHPRRNLITRAVGVSETVNPDFFSMEINEGAAVLLCSDGLYGCCEDYMLYNAVKNVSPEKLPKKLIDMAIENGSGDNISAAVII